ncbi:MAG: tetratricopeptide repeat protein [Vicinamibacteria bacterium]|nr:tetratricopeptide repeat protein [Vicinamibacteria bacterium]
MRSSWAIVARLAVGFALIACAGLQAQQLPPIAVDSYPAVSRQPIAQALAHVRAQPDDAARIGHLAMVLHAWEQYETAAGVYARARALERRYDWFYLGGLVQTRLAHHAAAARLLAVAVRLAPGSAPARLALADALFESGDVAAAAREYSSLTTGPGAPHAHYGLGRSLAAQGEKEAALREIEAAVRLFPEFGAAWYAEGMVLRGLGRSNEARKALEHAQQFGAAWPSVEDPAVARVRALRDDAGPHVKRGLTLQKQGDVAGAIAEYEAALAVDPQLASAHVNLIALYGRQQGWEKAESHYRALEPLGSVPAEAHYNFGICLAAQRKSTEAADVFRKALAVNPEHAGALSSLGQLAELEGRVDQAEASYRSAAAAAPNDPQIRFNVGRMLIARGQFTEAIAELDPLKSSEHPDRARFLFGLATAHVLAGHRDEGQRYAIQARDLARERGQGELADSIERELATLK